MDTYGHICIHMDTYGYIWGSRAKPCPAGPWTRVPWPWPWTKAPWSPTASFGPGHGCRATICIHMYACVHAYPYVSTYTEFGDTFSKCPILPLSDF